MESGPLRADSDVRNGKERRGKEPLHADTKRLDTRTHGR